MLQTYRINHAKALLLSYLLLKENRTFSSLILAKDIVPIALQKLI
jgi:hypothetical protein